MSNYKPTIPDFDEQDSSSLSQDEILQMRSQYIPKACGMHFERSPLKLVRAQAQYLYGDGGEEYIDCVNCVAHVGHCQPDVVKAGKEAMLKRGTVNYGVDYSAKDYIAMLRTTLPPELDTFLFVSSGSVANDVAIQLARWHSRGHDVVAVERAFHGSLMLTHDVSPRQYVADTRVPEYVHVVPCPDLYRGKYKESDPKAVEKYCLEAKQIMEDAVTKGRKLACFIAEPIMTVPGVIIPPTPWISSVYKDIRKLGGLAIADEAQSGLGRSGKTWWSFQYHEGCIPDILTIGKPLCNGYPTALVVTRRELVENLGPDFMEEYKCDAVTAAVGLAVINVIRKNNLMANADFIGNLLREWIKSSASMNRFIGDVRGVGLMTGVEIVYDRASRKPAKRLAEDICYQMKEHHNIILANDGTFKNVLIMTPPMCITQNDVHRIIKAFEKVFDEITKSGFDESEDDCLRSHFSFYGSNSLTADRLISIGMLDSEDEGKGDNGNDEDSEDSTNIFDILD